MCVCLRACMYVCGVMSVYAQGYYCQSVTQGEFRVLVSSFGRRRWWWSKILAVVLLLYFPFLPSTYLAFRLVCFCSVYSFLSWLCCRRPSCRSTAPRFVGPFVLLRFSLFSSSLLDRSGLNFKSFNNHEGTQESWTWKVAEDLYYVERFQIIKTLYFSISEWIMDRVYI